jgi:hypothetical protein
MILTFESSVGAIFAFTLTIVLPLLLYPTYHYFLHLLSTNNKCSPHCYLSPATQTCCLEDEEGVEVLDEF